jgi:hypothetical protein
MPLVTQNGIPPGNPQPGTPGGGAPPNINTQTGLQALALVPLGTLPVAIFPPYATPRTKPAVSVIFAEDPSLIAMNKALMRFKRSIHRTFFRSGLRRSQRRSSYVANVMERARYASR